MKNKIFGRRKFFKKVILIFKMQCFSTKTLPTLPRRFRFLPLSNKRNFVLLFYNGGLTTYPFLFFSSFSFQFLKNNKKEKEKEKRKEKEEKRNCQGRVEEKKLFLNIFGVCNKENSGQNPPNQFRFF